MISKFFNGKQLNNSVNPEEAVTLGAAIQAAILSGEGADECKDVLLMPVSA